MATTLEAMAAKDSQSLAKRAKIWINQHKLTAVGVGWATVVGTSMAYQWSRPIPMQLKIIHSRVYAQAFTIAAICTAGLVHNLEHPEEKK